MKNFFYIGVLFLLVSCGGSKKLASTETTKAIGAAKLVAQYYENELTYTTLEARTRLRYEDKKSSQSVTVNIRIEKDKKIWLNTSLLGITGARALITPEKVQFYDKLNSRYFYGDFEFLSSYLGVDIDFFQLQRLLTGQTVYDLREGSYDFSQTNTGYTVTPSEQLEAIKLLFSISAQNFMVARQRVVQPVENVSLDVAYRDYQEVGGKPFPMGIDILANDNQSQTRVTIDIRNIEINTDTRFPFSIPDGYTKMKLNAN